MDLEHKQLLDALEKILKNLNHIHNDITKLDEKYLRSESWKIYHDNLSKDMNNLGNKVREVEKNTKQNIRELEDLMKQEIININKSLDETNKTNQKQDIAFTKLSTKIVTILGILGGTSGIGLFIWYFIKTIIGG